MSPPRVVAWQRRRVKLPFQILVELRLIAFHHHQVGSPVLPNVPRQLRIGQAGIQREHHAPQILLVQQLPDSFAFMLVGATACCRSTRPSGWRTRLTTNVRRPCVPAPRTYVPSTA